MIDTKALQRIGSEVLDRIRSPVHAKDGSRMSALDTAFHAEKGLIPAAADRLGDKGFVVTHAVEITGIEHGYSSVQRRFDGRDAFPVAITVRRRLCPAHDIRHPHAAETNRGHQGAVSTELSHLHGLTPNMNEAMVRYPIVRSHLGIRDGIGKRLYFDV